MDCIERYIEDNLTDRRKQHVYGVVKTAGELAERYGEDPKKAETAALYHDMFRSTSIEVLNDYVRQFDLEDIYLSNANLVHGKVAAAIMEREYGIADPDILNAVRYHTTGRAEMSRLEMILYLADAIEPNRSYPGVSDLRKLAEESLERACLYSMERSIAYIKEQQGAFLHKDTIEARDNLKRKGEMNEL